MLTKGQIIEVVSEVTAESSLMPGMSVNNKTTSSSKLEVKEISENSFSLTSTTTHLKMDMDMMGQNTSYDSDKKEDQDSDIGKAMAGSLNVPENVTLDIFTGKEVKTNKADDKLAAPGNNSNALTGIFASAGSGGAAMASNAFLVIPANTPIGGSWTDSTGDKDNKSVRVFTLKSMDGNTATVSLQETSGGTTKIDYQGMEMQMSNTTKTTGDIISDITTGRVSSRTTKSEISGSMQIMGQDMPITASATTTTTYK